MRRPLKKVMVLLALSFIFLFDSFEAHSKSQTKAPSCESILNQASSVLVQDPDGRVVFSKNPGQYYVPASTIKVLTAFVAIKTLGENYKFHTLFYKDAEGNLKIKGLGDPFITSEVINSMTQLLAIRLSDVKDVILDDSYFTANIHISGSDGTLNPYDSPVGALCANFNTASVLTKNGKYISGEPHTPMINYIANAARQLNVSNGRFLIARTQEETSTYFGHLFLEFLRKNNIRVHGELKKGLVSSKDSLVLDFESPHSLSFVIKEMLKYSNNFIANQLFLASGAHQFGPPATLEKGISVTRRVADEYIGINGFSIMEGSGLSRENRLSANQFMRLLKVFYPYAHLLKEKDRVLYKTGTLKGVSNRIGYILVGNRYYPFVILRNGNGPSSASVLDCLKRVVAPGQQRAFKARAQPVSMTGTHRATPGQNPQKKPVPTSKRPPTQKTATQEKRP